MRRVTTFAQAAEFEKAFGRLKRLGLTYEAILPGAGFARVGVAALVADVASRAALTDRVAGGFLSAGWVDYRPSGHCVPSESPPAFEEDIFGDAVIMVLAPCVADPTKIRLIAHTGADMAGAFPYMNAEMREASYNENGPTLTFMDRYRVISLYPRRIAIAKADDMVDAWRTLEMIRCRVNQTWARRADIEPCHEMREKPPALEIFKRLPKTNCRACGERHAAWRLPSAFRPGTRAFRSAGRCSRASSGI